MTTDNPQTRRWFQFRLRTLLLLTTLACLLLGWLGQQYREAQEKREAQHRVKEAILALNGFVEYEHPTQSSWLSRFLGSRFSAPHISKILSHHPWRLANGPFLSDLDIGPPKGLMTDADLAHLNHTPMLKILNLDNAHEITDEGLKYLRGLTHLEELNLGSSNVTDAGLENLYGLTALREIDLADTQVTNEGCRKLRQALPKVKICR